MRTKAEIRKKVDFFQSYPFGGYGWKGTEDISITEVIKYGAFILQWVLGEVEEARYCRIHKICYAGSPADCPLCNPPTIHLPSEAKRNTIADPELGQE